MAEQKIENIEFDGLKVPIRRQPTHETYIALQPPNALPYIVAPLDKKPEEIVHFIEQRLVLIRELRQEMIKRFEKTQSLKCHYRTGDIAYLFGRPFMLRVYPLSKAKGNTKGGRGRLKIKTATQSDVSVITLFLISTKNYDQGKAAFLAYAKPLLDKNIKDLVRQCMERTFPDKRSPKNIKSRPMRDTWVSYDANTDTVWFSERLIPYPPDAIAYAFLLEIMKVFAPEATDEECLEILDRGVPHWKRMKEILADPDSPYAKQ